MPTYIFQALFAAVAFAFSNLVVKFASRHKVSNSWVLLFYSYFTVLPFALFLPLLHPVIFPRAVVWMFILFFGLLHVIGKAFFAKAVYRLDASTFSPFFQLQSAFLAVLSYLFLAERFSAVEYVFIALMFLGAMVVSLDERMNLKTFLGVATVLIILHQVFHAIANLFAGLAIKQIDALSFIFWSSLVNGVLVLPLVPVLGQKARVQFSQLKPLLLASFFSFSAAIALFAAYKTNVTVSSTLALLTAPIVLVVTFFASAFRPQFLEHHRPYIYFVRALGVAIILIGAIGLTLR